MNFLDANIIAYAFYRNTRMAACQEALRQGGVTDTFALAEAFFIISRETKDRQLAESALLSVLRSSLSIIPVDVNLFFASLKQSKHTGLSIFDLIHYHAALSSQCDAILTFDKDFDGLRLPRKEPD